MQIAALLFVVMVLLSLGLLVEEMRDRKIGQTGGAYASLGLVIACMVGLVLLLFLHFDRQ